MNRTGSDLLRDAVRLLTEAGVPDAAVDARKLLAHAMGVEPGRLTLILPEAVAGPDLETFEQLIERRTQRQPVAQIVGSRAFYGREFMVTSDVLDPRPETEILVEAALAAPFEHVLDLGTGSGCILLTLVLEMEGTRGVGTDISRDALDVATANARSLAVDDRTEFVKSDWFEGVGGVFDLIVSNPPYIAEDEMAGLSPEVRDWEPRTALTDEGDGLEAYRQIFARAHRFLLPEGRVLVEIGPTQARAVVEMAARAGFPEVRVIKDLDGRDRVVTAFGTTDRAF